MSGEIVMMEAALFQLCAAIGDAPETLPLRLSAEVMARAIADVKEHGPNPARVNEIEFALADLATAVQDAGNPPEMSPSLDMLRADAAVLRAAVALPEPLLSAIAALRAKVRERAVAMERGQYRPEGTPEPPLPHPPEELREEAGPIVDQLREAGFETPSLDLLLAGPDPLRYHLLNDIVDELDVITRS